MVVVVGGVAWRLKRGEIPRDGASFDWDVLNNKWDWRGELVISSFKFVFRCIKGADNDWSITGCCDTGIDVVDWVEGEPGWFVLVSDIDDWALVIDANFGKLKQARRIKWREFDLDGRTIPGLESSARNKNKLLSLKYDFIFT